MVKVMSSNYYRAATNDYFDYGLFKRLLDEWFSLYNVKK